jgi:hypothetical protein
MQPICVTPARCAALQAAHQTDFFHEAARLLARTWVLPAPKAGIFFFAAWKIKHQFGAGPKRLPSELAGIQLSTMMKFDRYFFHQHW